MIDLTKQKTFEFNPSNGYWCAQNDNFILYIDLDDGFYLMFLDESNEHWETACKIYSLEHLEKEYNSRSNHLFEWK